MLNFGASKPRVKGGPPLDPHLVGCIPSTAVAIVGGCRLPRGVCPGGVCLGICPGGVCLGGVCPGMGVHLLPRGQTDICKNITFPQLLLRTVIISLNCLDYSTVILKDSSVEYCCGIVDTRLSVAAMTFKLITS